MIQASVILKGIQIQRINVVLDIDVQDLAWSRDNVYLASGSVDGSVIVWNGTTFGNTRNFVA